jgi:selenium-binding protein 1
MPATLRPDPTFYPSPRLAMEAPNEQFAYVALIRPDMTKPDAIGVVDINAESRQYGRVVHRVDLTVPGDELHHFGWNACSSMLCPMNGHPFTERRYLVVPGMRSSRLYIVDTKPEPTQAKIVKVIEPDEVIRKTGYSRLHTVHCGPEGIYISTLGGKGADGTDGPPGIFLLDCESFEILGRWEMERGDQRVSYDFWWNIPHGYMISSEFGLPPQYENGVVGEELLANRYGHRLHFWDMPSRRHTQTIDLGENHQMALEVRPAHEPTKDYGFVCVVVDTTNLEASVWTWYRHNGEFKARKTITIPPEPADPARLPDVLKPFKAVPPFITDIDLSLDDRYLYVACWGTGELRQYDVSDPMQPKQTGSFRLGGIVNHTKHPGGKAYGGGPQMVEVSRDGQRVYFTNSLYSTWDDQFYPDGIPGAMVMARTQAGGGIELDPGFCVDFGEGYRSHQVRLEGGDCSTDSFCYPSA